MPNSGKRERKDLKGAYDAESSFLNGLPPPDSKRERKMNTRYNNEAEAEAEAEAETEEVDAAQAAADNMFGTDDVFADGIRGEQIQFEDRAATGKNKKGKKTRKKNKKGKKTRRKNKKGKKTRRRRR